jgi:hypothetical protein
VHRPGIGSCWHGSESLGSLKKSVLDQQNNCRFLKDENPSCNYSMSDNNTSLLIHVVDKLINNPRHNYTLISLRGKLLFLHLCFVGCEEHQLIQCLAPFLWLSLLESDVPTQNDNHSNAPQDSFTYDPVICRVSETSSTESNIKQSAPCKRPQSNISVPRIFTASGKKITKEFISILTPKASLIESLN